MPAPEFVSRTSFLVAGHAVIDEITDTGAESKPREELGGALCYSALCLGSLGYKVQVVTHVGEDFPQRYSRFLQAKASIDVDKWKVTHFPTTSFRIDRSLEVRRLWLLSKCKALSFEDFRRALDQSASTVPKTLILNPVAGEISVELLERVSKLFEYVCADSQGFTRQFDEASGAVSMKHGINTSCLRGVDTLKADDEELSAWTAKSNRRESISLLSTFVPNLIVTSGSGNVELYRRGLLSHEVRPLSVKVRDTTGAGDIMLAAFAARLRETNSLNGALEFATTASSLAIKTVGIRKAILSRSKIMKQFSTVRIA